MLISVSQPILEQFRNKLTHIKNFLEIRNGFDHDMLPNNHFNEVFTVVYAGTFYGKNKPDTFFEALIQLMTEGKLNFDWQLKLIGASKNFHLPKLLKKHVVFLSFCGE